ncbi:MAG: ATP-binding protein [Deltaproteobacteria bacterium]|nr:ATP-binding protein [Deltaproteobacteria bacterium]
MDITTFQLLNPWRTGRNWDVPHIERTVTGKISAWLQLINSDHAKPDDIYFFNLDIAGIKDFLKDQASFLRFLDIEKRKNTYVFIDEVQRLSDPGLFIKGLQDLRLPIKFVLTGSSSLDIRAKTQEALTGRKQVFHIWPLSFSEYIKTVPVLRDMTYPDRNDYEMYLGLLNDTLHDYSFYGGYPAVVSTESHEKKMMRLNEILTSYLEKDIAGFLKVENIPLFRKLVTLLSAQQGGLVNIQELSETLGANRETVSRYIHYLEETFVICRIAPYFSNRRTELSKMPKIYFSDPGLRNLARGGGLVLENLMFSPDHGIILEGIVTAHVFRGLSFSTRLNFWRTKSGAEVDLVVSDKNPVAGIEVKAGALRDIRITRGYRSFLTKYKPDIAIILNRTLWNKKEIAGCVIEAIPTAIFLLQNRVLQPPVAG